MFPLNLCSLRKRNSFGDKKSLKGIVNKTAYPVYLTERLLPKCWELQLQAKQMSIANVTKNCELQFLCPKNERGVRFRPIHMKAELLNLKNVALPLRNISTLDNGRPGKKQ